MLGSPNTLLNVAGGFYLPLRVFGKPNGRLAQLVERTLDKRGAPGSNPGATTKT